MIVSLLLQLYEIEIDNGVGDSIVDNFRGNFTQNQEGVCFNATQICINGTWYDYFG
jgi:hypothetical protein